MLLSMDVEATPKMRKWSILRKLSPKSVAELLTNHDLITWGNSQNVVKLFLVIKGDAMPIEAPRFRLAF
ncbi:hypothetical protein GCM10009124_03410 [Shewanella xiamenensis]|nr:hypothetical protein GCM10009124_03410 [Shewanella xiamenensis]GLD78591.1 hypothetical protein NUITMVS3_30230 [Shewanella xiamenensis]